MGDYTPVYIAGEIITLTAAGAITGGDLLEIAGSGTVQKCVTLGSVKFVGVAAEDCPTAGRVSFYCRGPVHESLADGSVTAGDQLTTTSTAGRQVKTLPASGIDVGATFVEATVNTAINGALNLNRAVIGVAITSAADGAKVRWMLFI